MRQPLPTVSQEIFAQRRSLFRLLLGAIVISLAILTYFAKKDPYFPLDLTVTRTLQLFHPAWFDLLMRAISFIGEVVPGTLLVFSAAAFLFSLGRKVDSVLLVFSVFGLEIIGIIMKTWVGRVRPDPRLIHQLTQSFKTDSFPSGHVLYYMGFFGFLLFLTYILPPKNTHRKILMILWFGLIVLVGLSRIYLGAHWFSDVVGAYLLGSLWLMVMSFLHHRFQPTVT